MYSDYDHANYLKGSMTTVDFILATILGFNYVLVYVEF